MEDLKQFEWFYMRKALGKPRRFSQAFIRSEIDLLNRQRHFIRRLQQGSQPDPGKIPLPRNVPLPLSVGHRVLARPNAIPGRPGGQVLPGYILAICSSQNSYRVQFDAKQETVQTVEDTQLATAVDPETIAVSVLMKERVYVPSAGIAERPRPHRRATSIQSLEQKRSPFSGGQNVMSSELMSKESERLADGYRARIDALCEKAKQLAETNVISPGPQGMSSWTQSNLRLLCVFEQLLKLKQALLADQAGLNAAARRLLAEETLPNLDLVQNYKFVQHYMRVINASVEICSAAIKARENSAPTKFQTIASTAAATTEINSQVFLGRAQRITQSAVAAPAGQSAQQLDGRIRSLIEQYVAQLLVVGSCSQKHVTPEDTALITRELCKFRNGPSTFCTHVVSVSTRAFAAAQFPSSGTKGGNSTRPTLDRICCCVFVLVFLGLRSQNPEPS